ncbi:hypothetical protein FA13DRAFT_1815460 [Coprinellus micaceus]|uniref:Uncharacterized protein n=1 Tax=Coprinellus micaceus TaxID=71717 RepID=A0A4Y7T432_COPMI|nr:hypothetical protein FA13DRAFT_1815460 [Coprinellus micaceus]
MWLWWRRSRLGLGRLLDGRALVSIPQRLAPTLCSASRASLQKDDNSLTIQHLDRPNAHEAAFSFGITSGEGEGEERSDTVGLRIRSERVRRVEGSHVIY